MKFEKKVRQKSEEELKQESLNQQNLVVDLIKRYLEIRDNRQQIDRTSKELKVLEQSLEQELWTLLESMGLKSVRTEEYGLISRTFRSNPFIKDFQLFRKWCIETENLELIQEQAKRQALRDYISSRLQEYDSDAIPPGVEWTVDKIIHVRGRTQGGEEDEV